MVAIMFAMIVCIFVNIFFMWWIEVQTHKKLMAIKKNIDKATTLVLNDISFLRAIIPTKTNVETKKKKVGK